MNQLMMMMTMMMVVMMMVIMGMLIMMMIDFQVEIDTARGVVDTSTGISRYSIQRLNPLSTTTTNVFREIFTNSNAQLHSVFS